ncbi:MAG: DUF6488 family protein [Nitrospiria bacterium]
MKKISAVLFVLFALSTPVVFAGPGSDHSHEPAPPISKDEALKTATNIVSSNVKKGNLAQSWGAVKPAKVFQKTFKSQPEWVITFDNAKVENKDRQTLYIFLSLSGHYLGANFTGE